MNTVFYVIQDYIGRFYYDADEYNNIDGTINWYKDIDKATRYETKRDALKKLKEFNNCVICKIYATYSIEKI